MGKRNQGTAKPEVIWMAKQDLNIGCPAQSPDSREHKQYAEPRGQERNVGWDVICRQTCWGIAKGTTFLSMQQTLLCAPQVTCPKLSEPSQISLRPVTPHWVSPAVVSTGRTPTSDWSCWNCKKFFKRWPATPIPPKESSRDLKNRVVFTPPGTQVAMDTTSPAWCFFCPLVLKLLCSSHPDSCWKRIFLPTSPKPVPH